MPIAHLPVELIHKIVRSCCPCDLAVLARSNTIFRDLAAHLLYRDLSGERSIPNSIRLLNVLASKPHLSRIVRLYTLRGRVVRFPLVSLHPLLGLHRLLRKSFRNMENLKVLDLDVYGSCGDIFLDCDFRLESVEIAVEYDPPFIAWLEGQSDLVSLNLKASREEIFPLNEVTLSHNALPKLRILHASPEVVAEIAAGKPLDQVRVFQRTKHHPSCTPRTTQSHVDQWHSGSRDRHMGPRRGYQGTVYVDH
jgi:hypothetical protein